MKKFSDSGEYFALSSYQIRAVPAAEAGTAGVALAKVICEDACYLSATGRGQTSIEILRLAEKYAGSKIRHYLIIRTHDKSEHDCVVRQEAFVKGLLTMLHRAGYVLEETTYEEYRKQLSLMNVDSAWALNKRDIHEYGIQRTYASPSITKSVDWGKIYTALDGSGCGLSIQIIPGLLSENEQRLISQNAAQCSQAVDGMVSNMRDNLAASSADRWKYYASEMASPFADVNVMVTGKTSNAALVTARIRQAVQGTIFCAIQVPDYKSYSIYNLPWKISHALKKQTTSLFGKWSSDEVSQIFQLPVQMDYFIGIDSNVFSWVPETELLPEQLTCQIGQRLDLGKSVFSSQNISVPLEQFLLHTAIMGKSGSGKTTLLKQMIGRLYNYDIPVLIMEPVKREYRDLLLNMKNSKIFTVERPQIPLHINPFLVPKGVTLGEYRSSLLSAFKAAFSLPDPLPALFEKAISEVYSIHGWTDASTSSDPNTSIFDMSDFIRIFKRVIASSSYSNEVKGNMMSGGAFRLQSLIERCPLTFDTTYSTSVEELLNGCVVLEMGSLEPEQKSLVSALTLISILAYLKATRKSEHRLKNAILIDEAHALLDQGEGATQEEKALNSTMTQLMINVITEIRAYGVGVIFADQSPSRVGGRLIDNVDNIISFRLSGKEAEMLKDHMGATEDLCKVLPLMSAGEFILKNRFLGSALPIRTLHRPNIERPELSLDKRFFDVCAHTKKPCPFPACKPAGCNECHSSTRNMASMYAAQIFLERQDKLRTPEDVAGHIIKLSSVMAPRISSKEDTVFEQTCGCVAIHLLRKCSTENNISFGNQAVSKLLDDMKRIIRKGENYNE